MAETKTCSTCRQSLPLEAFTRRKDSRDGRQNRCRGCWHRWYVDNRQQHIADVQRRNASRTKENRRRLEQHLRAHPCVDCGESDLRVLDFDHRDRESKRRTSQMAADWRSVHVAATRERQHDVALRRLLSVAGPPGAPG